MFISSQIQQIYWFELISIFGKVKVAWRAAGVLGKVIKHLETFKEKHKRLKSTWWKPWESLLPGEFAGPVSGLLWSGCHRKSHHV